MRAPNKHANSYEGLRLLRPLPEQRGDSLSAAHNERGNPMPRRPTIKNRALRTRNNGGWDAAK